jgi:hypothetical protein
MIDCCGVAEHSEECLCDVHVTEILPVIGRVDEGWMFRQVAERLNVGIPWDNPSILEVLSRTVELYDLYKQDNSYPEMANISTRAEGERTFSYYARVKQTISEMVAQHKQVPDPNKLLEHVGLSIDEFMIAVTCNRYELGSMDNERFKRMVQDIQVNSVRKISRDYGLNPAGSGKWLCTVFNKTDNQQEQQ